METSCETLKFEEKEENVGCIASVGAQCIFHIPLEFGV